MSNKKIEKSLPKLPITLGILTPTLGAYFHFFGYSYLKAKLEAVGFDYVSMNLSVAEGIYIALKGFLPAVMGIVNTDQINVLLKLMSIAFLGSVLFLMLAFLMSKVVDKNQEKKNFDFPSFFRRKIKSFKGALCLVPVLFTALGGVYVLMYLGIIFILVLGYAVAALGMAAGESKGYSLIETPVCKPAVEITRAFTGCRSLVLDSGAKITGVMLYKNDDSTYFLTNDAAYELDTKNKVKLAIPIHRTEEKKEASMIGDGGSSTSSKSSSNT